LRPVAWTRFVRPGAVFLTKLFPGRTKRVQATYTMGGHEEKLVELTKRYGALIDIVCLRQVKKSKRISWRN